MPNNPALTDAQKSGVDRAEIYANPTGFTLALWVDASPTYTFGFPTAAKARAWLNEQGAMNSNPGAPGPAVITDRDILWVTFTLNGADSDFAIITFTP